MRGQHRAALPLPLLLPAMGVFPRGQRPRRGGIEGSWLAALLALAPCDFLWPGLARCEARDVCLGLNEQQYYCDSGHCCGDNGCCTYYYELWWFWLLWTLVVLLSCCCAYRHRRSKLRSHQRARQRRIDMLAYRGACNYPGPPLDIRLMAVCKLPPYEEAILTQADTSPPPPYSELGPQRGGGLDVGPPPTASSDSSLGGGMVILHRADSSPEPHTDPSDYRPSASPLPAPPPPSHPSLPSSPAATTTTWSAATEDEGGCEPPVTRDPEEEEHGEQGAGQAAGGEVCGVEPSRDKEVAVTLTSTPASTPNPSVTPNVTPSVIQSVTQSVAPRPGSGKKRARFCPRLDVTVEIADGEESRTATHQEELPGNHGNDDDRDDGGGGEFGCGDDDDDDDGEETDHFRHRRLTGDSGIDVRPPDLVCDDDDGDNEVMEKDEEVALTHGRLATELGAKAHNGGQASAPQSSQLARTP